MGVGPSMADGSHGCKPNCVDLPVAAMMQGCLLRG